MSEATETVETTPAPETNGKPVKVANPKAKKVAKKAQKKEGIVLRAAQLRMLKALAKRNAPLTRQQLVHAATGSPKGTLDGSYLGNRDPKDRKIAEQRVGKPSLLTLGFVKMLEPTAAEREEGHTTTTFEITKKGKKHLASL